MTLWKWYIYTLKVKQTTCMFRILTGVLETLTSTSGVSENRHLMRDDLPTLLLPIKHTWENTNITLLWFTLSWDIFLGKLFSRFPRVTVKTHTPALTVTACSDWLLPFCCCSTNDRQVPQDTTRAHPSLRHKTDGWRLTLPVSYGYIILWQSAS